MGNTLAYEWVVEHGGELNRWTVRGRSAGDLGSVETLEGAYEVVAEESERLSVDDDAAVRIVHSGARRTTTTVGKIRRSAR